MPRSLSQCSSCSLAPHTPQGFEIVDGKTDLEQVAGRIPVKQIEQLEQNILMQIRMSMNHWEGLVHAQQQGLLSQIKLSIKEQLAERVLPVPLLKRGSSKFEGSASLNKATTNDSSKLCCSSTMDTFSPEKGCNPTTVLETDQKATSQDEEKQVLQQRGEDVVSYRQAMCWHNNNETIRERPSKVVTALDIWANHDIWNLLCGFVVLLNAIIIGWEAQQRATVSLQIALHRLGEGPECKESVYDTFFRIVDAVFVSWLSMELALIVLVQRKKFFSGATWAWNCFDSVVWLASLMGLLASLGELSFEHNVTLLRAMRVMRIMKLMRVMRIFKYLHFNTGMRKMVIALLGSLVPLLWAVCLIVLFMYCIGVIILQALPSYADDYDRRLLTSSVDVASSGRESRHLRGFVFDLDLDDSGSMSNIRALETLYGSVPRTLVTLFWAISGGDWGLLAAPLGNISHGFIYLYTFYTLFMVFGVLNVLTGIFCDNAMQAAHADKVNAIQEHLDQEEGLASKIRVVFHEADTDQSGTITLNELSKHLENPSVVAYLSSLGVEISEAKGLFALMDTDSSKEVNIEEFITGCLRVHGSAKAVDVATLLYENKKMAQKLNRLASYIHKKFDEQRKLLESLFQEQKQVLQVVLSQHIDVTT